MNKFEMFNKTLMKKLAAVKSSEKVVSPASQQGSLIQDDSSQTPKTRYTEDQLNQTYANFFIVSAIREEVSINFCIDNNWDLKPKTREVDINSRIVMSPYAAKRLSNQLKKYLLLIDQYKLFEQKRNVQKLIHESDTATKH